MIGDKNFDALFAFKKNIRHDQALGNKFMTMTNARVRYHWDDGEADVITRIQISLDRQPFSQIVLEDKEWLNADDFYVEFQTGYNQFTFDKANEVLTIQCNQSNKLGSYYKVEISEL